MANTTTKSPQTLKLLDQMLEDLAGDEYEDFDEAEADEGARAKRQFGGEDFSEIDNIH